MKHRVGERARWRVIYDQLATRQPDEVVTYEELSEALHLDPARAACRHLIQAAMSRAVRELRSAGRAVAPVPNVGYRIIPAVSGVPPATPNPPQTP